ncbi:60S ribosomal protein L7a [Myotis brandtii]|uniref:60S ribosomal protein L7a n=1 Tax=Myotis brandtii TaxID=109478 RepID=S7N3M0_MYOBR|nr:60S ribosomal protein L7a [Myotis brandtii]
MPKGKKPKGKKVAFAPTVVKQKAKKVAETKAAGKGNIPTKRPPTLVKNKKRELVVTARDVDPIKLLVFLSALCCKMGFPYCIIQGKARLGSPVHRKTCTTVTFTQMNSEDRAALAKLVEANWTNYNDRYDEIC